MQWDAKLTGSAVGKGMGFEFAAFILPQASCM
jgi:hypothetical protein